MKVVLVKLYPTGQTPPAPAPIAGVYAPDKPPKEVDLFCKLDVGTLHVRVLDVDGVVPLKDEA